MLPLSFRRTPLLFAACCFALGEAFTKFPVSPRLTILLAAGTAALLALTLLALRRAFQIVLLPLAALWLGIGLWSAQLEPAPAPQIALLAYADGLSRTIEGRIVRVRELPARPLRNDVDRDWDGWDEAGGTPALSVDLDVNAIEEVTPDTSRMVPIRGGVRLTVMAGNTKAKLGCGDRLRVPLRLRVPERYRDPAPGSMRITCWTKALPQPPMSTQIS